MNYIFFIENKISDIELKLFFKSAFSVDIEQISIRDTYDFPMRSERCEIEVLKYKASGDFSIYLEVTTSNGLIEEDKLAQKISEYFKCKTLFSDDLLSGYTWYMYDENLNFKHISVNQDLNDLDEYNMTIDEYL